MMEDNSDTPGEETKDDAATAPPVPVAPRAPGSEVRRGRSAAKKPEAVGDTDADIVGCVTARWLLVLSDWPLTETVTVM